MVTAGLAGDGTAISAVGGNASLTNGKITYASGSGGAHSFTYTATDAYGDTASATVTATVDPGPTARNGAITVGHDQTIDETGYVNSLVTAGVTGAEPRATARVRLAGRGSG